RRGHAGRADLHRRAAARAPAPLRGERRRAARGRRPRRAGAGAARRLRGARRSHARPDRGAARRPVDRAGDLRARGRQEVAARPSGKAAHPRASQEEGREEDREVGVTSAAGPMDLYRALYSLAKLLLAEDEPDATAELLLGRLREFAGADRGFIVVREGER